MINIKILTQTGSLILLYAFKLVFNYWPVAIFSQKITWEQNVFLKTGILSNTQNWSNRFYCYGYGL